MTDTTTLPADWAIERAIEVGGFVTPVALVKEHHLCYPTIINVARYIETKEQPPVDPWLLQARELAADLVGVWGSSISAGACRAGNFDAHSGVRAIAAALRTAYEEGKSA